METGKQNNIPSLKASLFESEMFLQDIRLVIHQKNENTLFC